MPEVSTPATRPRPSTVVAAIALALLLGLQPLTTDLYLPAFPALTRDLRAPMVLAQMTMSALILAFGLAQLAWGPVADRYGRRPVLLSGLALYIVASVGAALAGHIGQLVAARIAQGVGLAAAVVVARAMVRDLYEPHEGAHVMSMGLSGLGIIAITSPMAGGLVAHAWGWRATFWLITVLAAAVLAFVLARLPETVPQRNPQALDPRRVAGLWRQIITHPTFLAWAALTACTYGALFTFLAGSSFVYIEVFGISPTLYGVMLGFSSVAYILGTFTCRRWLPRLGMAGSVRRAAGYTLAGGLGMAALMAAGVHSVWAVVLPQMAVAFGHGVHQSCGQAGAVGPFPRQAGMASALAGFVLAATAFVIGRWLGGAMDGSERPMVTGIAFWSCMTTLVAWTLVRRHGQGVPAAAAPAR